MAKVAGLEPTTGTVLETAALPIELHHHLERIVGVEPTLSAWKADVLAAIRYSHKGGLPAFASCFNSKEVNCMPLLWP